VVFLDALVLKIREGGTVQRRACYLALGATVDGEGDVLGMWFQESEGDKFWMQALNELRPRGARDADGKRPPHERSRGFVLDKRRRHAPLDTDDHWSRPVYRHHGVRNVERRSLEKARGDARDVGRVLGLVQRLREQALVYMEPIVGIDADQVGIKGGMMDLRQRGAIGTTGWPNRSSLSATMWAASACMPGRVCW